MTERSTLQHLDEQVRSSGFTFLSRQARALLQAHQGVRPHPSTNEITVPFVETTALDVQPPVVPVRWDVLDRESGRLGTLADALPAQRAAGGDPGDVLGVAERLRAVLEAIYGVRLTFRGEQREATGTGIRTSQTIGTVYGTVTGLHTDTPVADVPIDVEQRVNEVAEGGSVVGMRIEHDR
jgi:hypothetical protein